jgi:hypothetical protein
MASQQAAPPQAPPAMTAAHKPPQGGKVDLTA